MKQRRDKWIRWLDVIERDIVKLVLYKDVFWETQKIIKSNKRIQKPSVFYDLLIDSYISFSVMAVRRQVKINRQSVSFARLLKEMSGDPKVISRKWFISLYGDSVIKQKMANKDFDKFCGENKDFIDPNMIIKDFDLLQENVAKIETYADKIVAHRDISEPKILPTFKELNSCIVSLDKLLCKYYLILKAISVSSFLPTLQYEWRDIFRNVWLTKKMLMEKI